MLIHQINLLEKYKASILNSYIENMTYGHTDIQTDIRTDICNYIVAPLLIIIISKISIEPISDLVVKEKNRRRDKEYILV